MTPGQEALVEAMRVEQARIYGNLLPDVSTKASTKGRKRLDIEESAGQDSKVADIRLARNRKGVA